MVGPSGCGKTVTLRSVMGFEHADSGQVFRAGRLLQGPTQFVPPEKRGIGFVFQDYALFPHLSVIRNVMFGIKGVGRRRRRQIATEALWMVGLMGMEDRRPHDLSGGQQQRVALARSIAPGNRVILLDEPFSSLDPALRQSTRQEVRMLAERGRIGIVLVTHDQEEALSTADRLAVMRGGRFEQTGEPEQVYNHPRTAFVAQFLGRTNLITAEARMGMAATVLGPVKLDQQVSGRVTLSLRPEQLSLRAVGADDPAGQPTGTIVAREFKGHDITFRVRFGPREFVAQMDCDAAFRIGDQVSLLPKMASIVKGEASEEETHEGVNIRR